MINAMENKERFEMPSNDDLINFAIVISEGKAETEELTNMVTMTRIIIDNYMKMGALRKND